MFSFCERMHVPAFGIDHENLGMIAGPANKDKPLAIGRPARSPNQFAGERRQLQGIVTIRVAGPDVPRTRERRLECNAACRPARVEARPFPLAIAGPFPRDITLPPAAARRTRRIELFIEMVINVGHAPSVARQRGDEASVQGLSSQAMHHSLARWGPR